MFPALIFVPNSSKKVNLLNVWPADITANLFAFVVAGQTVLLVKSHVITVVCQSYSGRQLLWGVVGNVDFCYEQCTVELDPNARHNNTESNLN